MMMISAGKALADPWSGWVELGLGYDNRSYSSADYLENF
jgi:hypothetical protein